MAQVTYIVISTTDQTPVWGAATGTDYYTVVVLRQDWADVPENGVYAGRSYKITEHYISHERNGLDRCISSSATPWE